YCAAPQLVPTMATSAAPNPNAIGCRVCGGCESRTRPPRGRLYRTTRIHRQCRPRASHTESNGRIAKLRKDVSRMNRVDELGIQCKPGADLPVAIHGEQRYRHPPSWAERCYRPTRS